MAQRGLGFKKGLELRDAGAAATLARTEKHIPNWVDAAISVLESFAKGQERFTSDDFRAFATGIIPEPPHHNSFGGLFIKASKAGIIRLVGYDRARRPSAHARVLRVWSVA